MEIHVPKPSWTFQCCGWGRRSAFRPIVEMNHPGVWMMGDLADDDRGHGMGIVVEYCRASMGKGAVDYAGSFELELSSLR